MLYFTLSPSFSLCVCLSPVSITSLLWIISSRNNLSSFPKICKKNIFIGNSTETLLIFLHTFFPTHILSIHVAATILRTDSQIRIQIFRSDPDNPTHFLSIHVAAKMFCTDCQIQIKIFWSDPDIPTQPLLIHVAASMLWIHIPATWLHHYGENILVVSGSG